MSLQGWKILVVEDEPDSTHLISELLEHYGALVQSARDGQECLEVLQNFVPNVIVMDLSMPVKDGWDTLKEIRANPSTKDIMVIATTAYHSASVAQDVVDAGFDGYVQKPFNIDFFIEQVNQLAG